MEQQTNFSQKELEENKDQILSMLRETTEKEFQISTIFVKGLREWNYLGNSFKEQRIQEFKYSLDFLCLIGWIDHSKDWDLSVLLKFQNGTIWESPIGFGEDFKIYGGKFFLPINPDEWENVKECEISGNGDFSLFDFWNGKEYCIPLDQIESIAINDH